MIDLELSKDMPLIRAASVDELVRRLIDQKQPIHYTQSFILTYRAFITPAELFRKVADYYSNTNEERVQRRILQVLKSWIEHYIMDFQDEEQLEKLLDDFIDFKVEAQQQMEAHELRKSNQARKALRDAERTAMSATVAAEKDKKGQPPLAVGATPGGPAMVIADMSEEEIAKQITCLESEMFLAIRPRELINQAWNKKEKETRAPNILAMIAHFNTAGQWVTTEIVQQYSLKPRAQLVAKFIGVLKRLMEMRNYQGVMEVLAGLYSSPVRRLTKTWEEVPAALKDDMATIEKTMTHQSCYKTYRALLRAVPAGQPCIPYLGMFLQDLTFIGDGNPDSVDGGLVNFYKHQKSAKVLADIQRLQEVSHTRPGGLVKNAALTGWLRHGKPCLEEKETYNVSLKIEPRNPSETLERLLMDEQALRKQLTELQVKNATLEEQNQKLQATVAYLSEQLGASQAHVRKTMAIGANSLAALRAQIKAEEEGDEEAEDAAPSGSLSPRPVSPRGPSPAVAVVPTTAAGTVKRNSQQRRSGRRVSVAPRKSVAFRGMQANPLAASSPNLLPTPAAAPPLPATPVPAAPPAIAAPVPPQPTGHAHAAAPDAPLRLPVSGADEARVQAEEEARRLKRRALGTAGGRERGISIAPLDAPDLGDVAPPAPAPAAAATGARFTAAPVAKSAAPMVLEPIGTTHARAANRPLAQTRRTITATEPSPTLDELLAARSAAATVASSTPMHAPDAPPSLRGGTATDLSPPLSFVLPEPDAPPPPVPAPSPPAVTVSVPAPAPSAASPPAPTVIALTTSVKGPAMAKKGGSAIARPATVVQPPGSGGSRVTVNKPVAALPDVYAFLADDSPAAAPAAAPAASKPPPLSRAQTEQSLSSSSSLLTPAPGGGPIVSPRGPKAPATPAATPDAAADSPLALPGERARQGVSSRPQSLAEEPVQARVAPSTIKPQGRHQYISLALSPQQASAMVAAGAAQGGLHSNPLVSPRGKPSAAPQVTGADFFAELEALTPPPDQQVVYRSKPLPKPPART